MPTLGIFPTCEVSGFGHVKLSGSANAEAEIVIFSINQVVQMYKLKADVFSRNEVFHSEHLKISRVANATPEITRWCKCTT